MAEQLLTAEIRADWAEALDEFTAQVYPIFQRRGVILDTALVLWELNKLNNRLQHIVDMLEAPCDCERCKGDDDDEC